MCVGGVGGKWMAGRRCKWSKGEEHEMGRGRKLLGNKSEDAENVAVPKFEDCKQNRGES
jgi:hypothetical protein